MPVSEKLTPEGEGGVSAWPVGAGEILGLKGLDGLFLTIAAVTPMTTIRSNPKSINFPSLMTIKFYYRYTRFD